METGVAQNVLGLVKKLPILKTAMAKGTPASTQLPFTPISEIDAVLFCFPPNLPATELAVPVKEGRTLVIKVNFPKISKTLQLRSIDNFKERCALHLHHQLIPPASSTSSTSSSSPPSLSVRTILHICSRS